MWFLNRSNWKSSLSLVLVHVRTATKRAAGSRTSMKDSAGRRLGPKKYEGHKVKPGQIIMRQRGTKFYPGENVGIGKDHTIFALEPGYVRYYMDPFHAKRKFIGVALSRDLRLPTPLFSPRFRRLGREVIYDVNAAAKEEAALPRKLYMAKERIEKGLEQREERRRELSREIRRILCDELGVKLEDEALDLAIRYLVRVRSNLRNGFKIDEAHFNSQYYMKQEMRLEDGCNKRLQLLEATTKEIQQVTSFDNKYVLIRHISEEEKKVLKMKLLKNLSSLNLAAPDYKNTALGYFSDASKYLTLSEEVHLRRKYLKKVRPEWMATAEAPSKNTKTIRRYNYEKGRIDVVFRTREAFLSNM